MNVSFTTKCSTFFTEKNLISPTQSGFSPGDSCIYQLLAAHEICKSFNDGVEWRGIFINISKASDKVWYASLLFKLNRNGIPRNLLKFLHDFLYCRKQQVVSNSKHSSWDNVQVGVPQGSVSGSLLFLIYINDLSNGLPSNCELFADYTSLFSVVNHIETSASTLCNGSTWPFQWKMNFNPYLYKTSARGTIHWKLGQIKKLLHPTLLFNNIPLTTLCFRNTFV